MNPLLAKVGVGSSNPLARSNFFNDLARSDPAGAGRGKQQVSAAINFMGICESLNPSNRTAEVRGSIPLGSTIKTIS